MVKLIMAATGSGKTKNIIDLVNEAAAQEPGSIVCIAKGNQLNFDISHKARLINVQDYSVSNYSSLLGFVAGIHAGNYDITKIFIDSLYKVACDDKPEDADQFILALDEFSSKHSVEFTVALSGDAASASDVMKKYL
ncbi:hypothetical protein [Butyricicoccus porcorum]|uniref:Helicase/UvrB N-terminal domain-containing protein n=1 Tax=Butyricicoccus porcorum TaxID=1945634 RepID=A0A252F5D0_9FIRM|nr:hypothetical protein [Butyricicoccus porcorum]MCI6926889.1 hypothetical protein [Butyricicoccus porcorum]MDY4484320.1 hypothetical protein [Butyricicoccus porcorum]OUM20979.1 hypothetical protein CBW42_05195 [Butyricicoccus porcorum]